MEIMKKYIVLNDKGYPQLPIYFEGEEIPKNAIEIDDDTERHYLNSEYKDNGKWAKIPTEKNEPTAEEIQAQLTNAVQVYMDKTVQARNYDNIATACTYSTSTDHIFATEGIACVKWRDAVWRFCYEYLAEVKAGTKEVPTAEELIAMLPTLEW